MKYDLFLPAWRHGRCLARSIPYYILEFDGPKKIISTKLCSAFHPGRKLQEIVMIIIVTFFACWILA